MGCSRRCCRSRDRALEARRGPDHHRIIVLSLSNGIGAVAMASRCDAPGATAARRWRCRREAGACLSVAARRRRASTRASAGLRAVDDVSLDARMRRDPRGDRHQRRRQVDADQHALRRARADRRDGRAWRPRRHRLDAGRARARRPRPLLPAHHDLPALHACSRTAGSRRRRARRGRWRCSARAGARRRRRGARRARRSATVGLGGSRRRRRRHCSATASSASSRSRWCLATDPTVLLLDEPLAGMGAEETDAHARAARSAQAPSTRCCWSSTTWTRCSRVADRITVMVNGAVIASGAPREVRANRGGARRPISASDAPPMSALLLAPRTCTPTTATSHILRGVVVRSCAGETVGLLGPQRHGQDDADPHR